MTCNDELVGRSSSLTSPGFVAFRIFIAPWTIPLWANPLRNFSSEQTWNFIQIEIRISPRHCLIGRHCLCGFGISRRLWGHSHLHNVLLTRQFHCLELFWKENQPILLLTTTLVWTSVNTMSVKTSLKSYVPRTARTMDSFFRSTKIRNFGKLTLSLFSTRVICNKIVLPLVENLEKGNTNYFTLDWWVVVRMLTQDIKQI